MDYSKHTNQTATVQTEPIFGRTDQVENNAGGYVFKVSNQHLLERFLLIGSEGGTYYVSEQELTVDNAKTIVEMIKNDGLKVLSTVRELATRAPKRDPAIFVLALACTYGSPEVKLTAYTLIKEICKTSTHLFTFCQNIKNMRGWSRGLRRGVSNFYTSKTAEQIAYQLVKYRQRNGWTHKDVIKLSHPVAANDTINSLFRYAVGTNGSADIMVGAVESDLIKAYEAAQQEPDTNELVSLIKEFKLTWEMIPTQVLNNKEVLEALLQDMPLTAMVRNLNRMTLAGLFDSNLSDSVKLVVSQLTNKELLQKAGIHPVNLLNSLKTYATGQGFRGGKNWTPNQKVVDALDEAFQLSFDTLQPTNKNILIAVDVSGSMSSTVANMSLNAKEVAAALSLSLVKTEPNIDLVWFDTQLYRPATGKRSSFDEVIRNTPNGGGTDCSLPYQYALQSTVKYDAVIMLTDNETWAGKSHVVQLQERYQKAVNPNCKHVVIGMTATKYSVLTDNDPNVLHVAGFDAAIPQLISNFISPK